MALYHIVAFSSYSCSDIEEIHNELMRVLINGHVGFNEDSETHTNWKMKFKTYCDDTTERKGCVRGNIEYLEKKKTIGHGNYGVLKKIFAEDEKALCKIEEALTEIEKLRSSANISNKNTKGEFLVIFFYKKNKYRLKTAYTVYNLIV